MRYKITLYAKWENIAKKIKQRIMFVLQNIEIACRILNQKEERAYIPPNVCQV